MSLRRSRIAIAAVMSSSLLVGLAVAGSSGAATPDTAVETSVATTPDSAAETSAPSAPETAAVEILPPDESWGGLTRGEWEARVVATVRQHARGRQPVLRHDRGTLRIRTVRAGLLPAEPNFERRRTHLCGRRGHSDLCAPGGQRVLYRRATAVLRANRGRVAGVRRRWTDGWTDRGSASTGRKSPTWTPIGPTSPLFTLTFPENNVAGRRARCGAGRWRRATASSSPRRRLASTRSSHRARALGVRCRAKAPSPSSLKHPR